IPSASAGCREPARAGTCAATWARSQHTCSPPLGDQREVAEFSDVVGGECIPTPKPWFAVRSAPSSAPPAQRLTAAARRDAVSFAPPTGQARALLHDRLERRGELVFGELHRGVRTLEPDPRTALVA